MRRSVVLLCVLLLAVGPLAGCLSTDTTGTDSKGAKKIAGATETGPAVFPGTYKFDGAYSQVLAKGTLGALPAKKVFIKSDIDGADIEIGFHLPDVPAGTKVPVIVQASPYHRVSRDVTTLRGLMLFLHDNFLPHGYAVAGVSVRGTGNSGGCMDLMGAKEVKDLDKAITWLGTQDWSNGNVAMIGVSYDGSTPWDVAATGNKHLKSIVPISGLPDIFGLMYRNGSAEYRGFLLVNAAYYTYGPSLEDSTNQQNAQYQREPARRVQGTACPDYAVGLASAGYSTVVGDRDPTGYWAERNRKPAIEEKYRGSILLVQGLQDWNVDPSLVIPWVNKLNASGAPLKQMLGQWGHANPDSGASQPTRPTLRWDWAEILLHWFDRYLKEKTDVETGPAVQVQDQTMRWHNEEHFPPRNAMWTQYHLNTGSKLALEKGPASSQLLLPNPAAEALGPMIKSMPGYSADFSTAPTETGLTISGLPRLHVTFSPKGPTGHVAGFLYNVDPSGTERLVGRTTMNLWYADGTENRKPLVPNTPVLAKMEFQPLDVFIKPGNRLMVRIWEYQDTDRLPALPPQPVELLWGGSSTSYLELPLLERTPADYFAPPFPNGFVPSAP